MPADVHRSPSVAAGALDDVLIMGRQAVGVAEVGRFELGQGPAVLEHDDPLGPDGHRRLVGHDDDRPALLLAQFLQQPADPLTGDRVEAAGRLVGQQDGRFGDDGPGDGDSLLLAAAQGVGRMTQPIGHA